MCDEQGGLECSFMMTACSGSTGWCPKSAAGLCKSPPVLEHEEVLLLVLFLCRG